MREGKLCLQSEVEGRSVYFLNTHAAVLIAQKTSLSFSDSVFLCVCCLQVRRPLTWCCSVLQRASGFSAT